ncbi:uncharacterized protein LOC122222701 [Panthera leo]|uniref:uncharacterized protein LOC122222701 n=1 Tax=Panthera leo TaxID=9689 RepID=UPI001C698E9A|nr:uncharacterized protein LOC122222701 [Panthera leo]
MKGHLPEVDSGGGEGRLEGGAHHPGSGWGTTHRYRPKIRTLRGEKPPAQAPPGEALPCGPCRKPTAPAAGPGGACSPAALLSSCGLRFKTTLPTSSSPRNSAPLRVLPARPRFCHSLLGPDGNSPLLLKKPTLAARRWQACCPRTGHWGQKGRKTHGGGELLCAPGRGGTAPVSTSVLPGAICSSGVSHRSPHGAVADSGGTPRPARRPKGPARPERRECELRQGSPLLDREPHEAAAGTEWARSRNTAARPRRPAPVRSARRNSSASNCDYRHVPLSLAATSPPDCCSQYTRFPVTSSCSEDSFPEGQDVSDPKLFAVEAKPQQVPLRCATHSLLAAPLPGRKLCPGHSPLGMLGT